MNRDIQKYFTLDRVSFGPILGSFFDNDVTCESSCMHCQRLCSPVIQHTEVLFGGCPEGALV